MPKPRSRDSMVQRHPFSIESSIGRLDTLYILYEAICYRPGKRRVIHRKRENEGKTLEVVIHRKRENDA
jgi:hypothetical protein